MFKLVQFLYEIIIYGLYYKKISLLIKNLILENEQICLKLFYLLETKKKRYTSHIKNSEGVEISIQSVFKKSAVRYAFRSRKTALF